MPWIRPTVSEFKDYFFRDFPFGSDMNENIVDKDIEKAMGEAECSFNEALWPTQEKFTIAFMLVTAHFLVMDIRASNSGINGSYPWTTQSKSVGSVSESFGVPPSVMDNPILAMFSKTYYGAKYVHLVLPYLVAPIFSVCGATTP